MMRLTRAYVLLLLCLAPAQGGIRTIALTGQPAPGIDDIGFRSVEFCDLNDPGQVLVFARLESATEPKHGMPTDSGLWVERRKRQLELVVRAGDQPEAVDDDVLAPTKSSQLRDDGTVDFLARSLTAKNSGRQFDYWSKDVNGQLRPVLRLRGVAPGVDGATFVGLTGGPVFNRSGQVAFHSMVNDPSASGKGNGIEGVWAQNTKGQFDLIARRPRNHRFQTNSWYPKINDFGDVVMGYITRAREPEYSPQGHGKNLIAIHGVTFPIVQRNDPIQYAGQSVRIIRTSLAGVNNAGQLAFYADLAAESERLRTVVKYDPAKGLRILAYHGMQPLDRPASVTLSLNSQRHHPYINRAGNTVFWAPFSDQQVKRSFGLWTERDSGLQLIAYEGEDAVGAEGKVFQYCTTFIINAHGQVAFQASLKDPQADEEPDRSRPNSARSAKFGIWAQQLDGTLRNIVCPGDELSVGPNDSRIVQSASLVGNTGNEDGSRSGFNDRGLLAFEAVFTDGSGGVFVSDLVSHDSTLPPVNGDLVRLRRDQIEGDRDVKRLIGDLARRTDEEIAIRRKREEKTDGFKLQRLADSMQAQYTANTQQLEDLRQHLIIRDNIALEREITSIVKKQQLLESYWAELRTRIPSQTSNMPLSTSSALTRDAAYLMRRYGNAPAIRRKIADLMKRLADSNSRRTVVQGEISTGPFDPIQVSAPFAHSIATESTATSQESESHMPIVDGLLKEVRKPLGQIVGLKWQGKNLTVNREHWDLPFGGESRQEFLAGLDRMLRSKGLSDDLMTRTGRRRRAALSPDPGELNVMVLFMKLRARAKTHSGGSFGGRRSARSSERQVRFSSETASGRMKVAPNGFQLGIHDHDLDQLFQIDSHDRELHIALQSDQCVFDLQQSVRQTQLSYITDDTTVRLTAGSFAELYRDHPEFVERHFYRLLDELGIKPPLHRFDRAVTSSVLQQLSAFANSDHAHRAAELIAELDHDVFATRNAAAKELQANFPIYRPVLEKELANPQASFEVRRRLKNIIATHTRKHREIEEFLASMQLLSDAPYLVALLERARASDRQIVGHRLRELTRQDLPPDAERWREWLEVGQHP